MLKQFKREWRISSFHFNCLSSERSIILAGASHCSIVYVNWIFLFMFILGRPYFDLGKFIHFYLEAVTRQTCWTLILCVLFAICHVSMCFVVLACQHLHSTDFDHAFLELQTLLYCSCVVWYNDEGFDVIIW